MNKRGQGLPLTTVIIAILVILVLVIIVFFFLGGMRGVTERIGNIFSKTVAGTDLTLAVQSCQNYCDQAKLLPKNLRENSAYCKTTFNVDLDNDGEAQYTGKDETKIYTKFACSSDQIGVKYCQGVYERDTGVNDCESDGVEYIEKSWV